MIGASGLKTPAGKTAAGIACHIAPVDEFEHVLIFWKPGITMVNRERLDAGEWTEWGSRAVWYIPSVRSNSEHESQFPVELPRRVIKLLTEPGDLVLDCFAGSGTTVLAAASEGREFIGFDINPESVKLAKKRVNEVHAIISSDVHLP